MGLPPFHQSMTLEELRYEQGITGEEEISKDELDMLIDLEEEFSRRGNF